MPKRGQSNWEKAASNPWKKIYDKSFESLHPKQNLEPFSRFCEMETRDRLTTTPRRIRHSMISENQLELLDRQTYVSKTSRSHCRRVVLWLWCSQRRATPGGGGEKSLSKTKWQEVEHVQVSETRNT